MVIQACEPSIVRGARILPGFCPNFCNPRAALPNEWGMNTKRPSAAKPQPNRTPLLGKGGVAAPSSECPLPLKGADGVVRSTTDKRWLEPTTPSAPAKDASRHFLNGRIHPSFTKGGFAQRIAGARLIRKYAV